MTENSPESTAVSNISGRCRLNKWRWSAKARSSTISFIFFDIVRALLAFAVLFLFGLLAYFSQIVGHLFFGKPDSPVSDSDAFKQSAKSEVMDGLDGNLQQVSDLLREENLAHVRIGFGRS